LRSCAAVPARCRLRLHGDTDLPHLPSFPTRRSSDLSLLSDLVREALLGPEVVLRLDDGLERPVEVVPGRFLRGLHLLDRGVRRRVVERARPELSAEISRHQVTSLSDALDGVEVFFRASRVATEALRE